VGIAAAHGLVRDVIAWLGYCIINTITQCPEGHEQLQQRYGWHQFTVSNLASSLR